MGGGERERGERVAGDDAAADAIESGLWESGLWKNKTEVGGGGGEGGGGRCLWETCDRGLQGLPVLLSGRDCPACCPLETA